jgi:hypothetical protein
MGKMLENCYFFHVNNVKEVLPCLFGPDPKNPKLRPLSINGAGPTTAWFLPDSYAYPPLPILASMFETVL